MLRPALALSIACALLGCSDDPEPGSPSTASSASGSGGEGGGAGGSGGVAALEVCVSSPEPAAFPGTDDCPAPMPQEADALDAALAVGELDRCGVRLRPEGRSARRMARRRAG
jgi:hypothetical protein